MCFLLAQQRCDRLVLQRLFQWSDSELSDAIHQVSERAARLGMIVTEENSYLALALDDTAVTLGG